MREAGTRFAQMLESPDSLRVIRYLSGVTTLGPYKRAVVWVQGCPFRCPGCITPEGLPFDGGMEVQTAQLADWVIAQKGIEGVTFSGGEPMKQAAGLSRLVDIVRRKRNIGVMSFTGYTYEKLLRRGTDAQRNFLSRIDLLVDGPYVREEHADILWRGSANQRLIFLTARYEAEVMRLIRERGDTGAGLEIRISGQGEMVIVGVPGEIGFGLLIREILGQVAG